jgi:hypothetical protein
MKIWGVVLLAGFLFMNCRGHVACMNPPLQVNFVLLDSSGNNLFDSLSSPKLRVSYKKEGYEYMVNDAQVYDSFPTYNYVCSSHEMVWRSEEGIKEFQISYAGRTDTFYLDAEKKHDGQCTYEEINGAKFNGEPVDDEHLSYGGSFVLKRK